jgi:hypothetical protein
MGQTVRYYGFYSNKSRGMRKKANTDDRIPAIIPNEMSSKEFRQNWARLIQTLRFPLLIIGVDSHFKTTFGIDGEPCLKPT